MNYRQKSKKRDAFLSQNKVLPYATQKAYIIRTTMTLYNHAKNIALIVVLAYFAPTAIKELHTQYAPLVEQRTNFGIINLSGDIQDSSFYTKNLCSFFENAHIKGILLTIDHCTMQRGTAYALFNEINQLKKEHHKPLVVLIENKCSTEGYLVACAADHIIASETALIECDVFNITTKDTKETSANNDIQQQYIKLVATTRKLSFSTQDEWAHGTITGHQARTLKLIDQTGSLHNAITFFKQKTLVLGNITWIEAHKKTDLLSCLSHVLLRNQQAIL